MLSTSLTFCQSLCLRRKFSGRQPSIDTDDGFMFSSCSFLVPCVVVISLHLRSQLRTLLHFPLFRHIVNVNCATAFSYPFIASPPQSSSHPFSCNVTNSPRTPPAHHVPLTADHLHSNNVVSTEESRPFSPQQQLHHEGKKLDSSVDTQPREDVRLFSPGVCSDGVSRKTEGGREGRSGEGGMKQKDGCEFTPNFEIREVHDGDVSPKRRGGENDRDEGEVFSGSVGKGETYFSPDSSPPVGREEENTKRMKEKNSITDVYGLKNTDVRSGAKEGKKAEDSRETKSQRDGTGDPHVQGCCPASSPTLGYRGGKRDELTPLQPVERGKENSHVDTQNPDYLLHSYPRVDVHQPSPLEISSSSSPTSSFFSSSYPHSHLFTPAVFSTWGGGKREQLFSRCAGDRRNSQRHAAGEKAGDASPSRKSRRSSIRDEVIESGEGNHISCEDSHRLDSSSQSSACPLFLPISLASPPSKLQVLRCMLADTAAVRRCLKTLSLSLHRTTVSTFIADVRVT